MGMGTVVGVDMGDPRFSVEIKRKGNVVLTELTMDMASSRGNPPETGVAIEQLNCTSSEMVGRWSHVNSCEGFHR